MNAEETGIRINNKKVFKVDDGYAIEEDHRYLRQPLKSEKEKILEKLEKKDN